MYSSTSPQPVSQPTTNSKLLILQDSTRAGSRARQPVSILKMTSYIYWGDVCNSATFRCRKTNLSSSEGWAAVSPQSDLLVFLNCCFAGMKNTGLGFFLKLILCYFSSLQAERSQCRPPQRRWSGHRWPVIAVWSTSEI